MVCAGAFRASVLLSAVLSKCLASPEEQYRDIYETRQNFDRLFYLKASIYFSPTLLHPTFSLLLLYTVR